MVVGVLEGMLLASCATTAPTDRPINVMASGQRITRRKQSPLAFNWIVLSPHGFIRNGGKVHRSALRQ